MGQVLRAWESSRSDPRGAKPGCGGEITKRAALAKKEKIELKIKVSWYIKVCCKEEKRNIKLFLIKGSRISYSQRNATCTNLACFAFCLTVIGTAPILVSHW